MRKVIYSMMVSLDGFIETTEHKLDWVVVDAEIHRFANDEARDLEMFLYGRRIYELMAEDWPRIAADRSTPDYMLDFARIWKDKPKVVFSKTLAKVEWNSRLVRENAADEISKLKEGSGRDMAIAGPTLAAAAMRRGLIDEYRLLINPVVLGAGTPFFPTLASPIRLRFVEKRTFNSGVVYVRYETERRRSDA